jgi:hypothetical protein
LSNHEIAAWLHAIRTKASQPDKFNGRPASSAQMKRLYTFISRALTKPSLRKVMLQVITGKPLMRSDGVVSGFLLGMGYASTLITELELKDGIFGAMLLSEIEERLRDKDILIPWNLFDEQWIQTNMSNMPVASYQE